MPKYRIWRDIKVREYMDIIEKSEALAILRYNESRSKFTVTCDGVILKSWVEELKEEEPENDPN